jgi:histidine ammonia-lyase
MAARRGRQRRGAAATPAILHDGELTLADLRTALERPVRLRLSPRTLARVRRSARTVERVARRRAAAYGINTGFGLLAQTRIPPEQLQDLQRNLVLSHSAGTGPDLPDAVVRLVLVLKIASLAQGYSGVRPATLAALQRLLGRDVYPCVPSQGSVGASGDLAPLAHLSATLLGVGRMRTAGRTISAARGLQRAGLEPLTLAAKEGLALLNGTQVSTALALAGLFAIENVYAAALIAGALSVDALQGSDAPFDDRIQVLRRQPGQRAVAQVLRALIAGSRIRASHIDCGRVQDPYSLRCQPQVMGACLDLIGTAAGTLAREANAVTDNPLVFPASGAVLSGGNFHAEPVAFAADQLARRRDRLAVRAAHRAAGRSEDERPAGVPGGEQRRELRIHDAAGHGGRAGLGEQVAGAPGQRRQHPDLGQPGGPRVDGHLRRAAPHADGGQRGDGRGHRAAGRRAGTGVPPAAAQFAAARGGAAATARTRAATRGRSLPRAGHRGRACPGAVGRVPRIDRSRGPALLSP